jgi:hypothetical protein
MSYTATVRHVDEWLDQSSLPAIGLAPELLRE